SGPDARRPAVSGDGHRPRSPRERRDSHRRSRGARGAGRGIVRALDGAGGSDRRHASGTRLAHVTLRLVTAGESHGRAPVPILPGLPAGLQLDGEAIDGDLARRRQGYGRSPRQSIERDEIEVLAGLRHGTTLGSPLAFLIRNRDHESWAWGMSPWPPE